MSILFMNDFFSKVWTWIKSLPVWLRAVVLVLVSAFLLIFSVSCGPAVRVSARTTTDSVTISISQNIVDSTGVSVSVNPNINIHP